MSNLSIGLNSSNDIYVGEDGNLVMVSNIDAVEQDCLCAMKAQFGEMFLQPTSGLPTLQDVWQSQNFIKWIAVGRSTLAGVPGVTKVISFNVSPNGDVLNYTAVIQTVYSNFLLTISETLG